MDGDRRPELKGYKSRGRVIKASTSFQESKREDTPVESEVVSDDEGLGGCKFLISWLVEYNLLTLSERWLLRCRNAASSTQSPW
jgi:hypothetical protein